MTLEYKEISSGRLEDTTFCIREHPDLPGTGNLSGDTVASDMSAWLKTLAKAMAPNTLSLSRVTVNRGGPWGPGEGEPQESGEHTIDETGTLATSGTATVPHGLCMRVTVKTSLASRRGRGRFHAPSPHWAAYKSEAAPDNWSIGGGYWNAVVDFANALLAGHDVTHDLLDHHYSLRVHSRKDSTTRDAVAVVPRVQVSYLRTRLTAP